MDGCKAATAYAHLLPGHPDNLMQGLCADEGGYTVFGPDYAHQKGTGFGHYAGLIPHIENGTLVTGAGCYAAAASTAACLRPGSQ